jgi:hypothetical protein
MRRYEMMVDTRDYSADYPLQWGDFQERVIPGIAQSELCRSRWTDDDHVVVRLRDDETHWAWERLAYSDQAFVPVDPAGVATPAKAPTAPTVPTTAPAG